MNQNPPTIPADVSVFRARMSVQPESIDAFLEAMALLEPAPGAWEDVDTGEAWIEAFAISESEIQHLALQISQVAESVDGHPHGTTIEKLEPQDWTESWKKFFHVIHVTDRIVIRPIWEDYTPSPTELVIALEPGMSFGTGLHATTQSCIRFIQKLAETGSPSRSLIDLGCGSGILAIAARKLGFTSVKGFDYDPLCVKVSDENAALNDLQSIPFALGNALDPVLPSGDIIVANILAPVLLEAAPALAKALSHAPGHALILAGILHTQYPAIKATFEAQGLQQQDELIIGEWHSGLFTHNPT